MATIGELKAMRTGVTVDWWLRAANEKRDTEYLYAEGLRVSKMRGWERETKGG